MNVSVGTLVQQVKPALSHYLSQAKDKMAKVAVNITGSEQTLPVTSLIEKVSKFSENDAIAVQQVLSLSESFNQAIREQLESINVATRYSDIADNFTSIRTDAERQLAIVESGSTGILTKFKLQWMDVRRGSFAKRFSNIRSVFIEVSDDLRKQLDREEIILDGYADFRLALKEGEIAAYRLSSAAKVHHLEAMLKTEKSIAVVNELPADTEASVRSQLELARDSNIRDLRQLEKQVQITNDLAENLQTSYNLSDVIFARVQQANDVKERIFQRAVIFFATNETVFTGMTSALVALQGVNEGTKTIDAMSASINEGIEVLGKVGNEALKDGIRAGYGVTVKASSVKILLDSVIAFQESTASLIKEAQEHATSNATQIEAMVDGGRLQFAKLLLEANQK